MKVISIMIFITGLLIIPGIIIDNIIMVIIGLVIGIITFINFINLMNSGKSK